MRRCVARPRTILLLAVLLLATATCTKGDEERILFDFENDTELDQLHWHCRTAMVLDPSHATRGRLALRLDMHPDLYPGFRVTWNRMSWTGFRTLRLDGFNPQPNPVRLLYRIDDRTPPSPYADRVNGAIDLPPGGSEIVFDLHALRTSGTGRPLDLHRISGLFFYLLRPEVPVTLHLDALRLSRLLPLGLDVMRKEDCRGE